MIQQGRKRRQGEESGPIVFFFLLLLRSPSRRHFAASAKKEVKKKRKIKTTDRWGGGNRKGIRLRSLANFCFLFLSLSLSSLPIYSPFPTRFQLGGYDRFARRPIDVAVRGPSPLGIQKAAVGGWVGRSVGWEPRSATNF